MDANEKEYLGAVAGMHEHTISPAACHLPAIGDFVSGCSAGRNWSGYVHAVEAGRMVVEAGGCWLSVDPADITH